MAPRASSIAAALLLAACASKAPGQPAHLVARGEGVAITADEVRARIEQQPPQVRPAFASPERKRQFLEDMLQLELLARGAGKEGLAADRDVQLAAKRAMVAKFRSDFLRNTQPSSVTGAEVKQYYEEHIDEFRWPLRVHAATIFLAADASGPGRARRLAEARRLLSRVLAEERRNPAAFGITARDVSEDPDTRSSGGDLAYRSWDELVASRGREFADVAFALRSDETAPRVLESERGFHLVHVYGRQEQEQTSLEEARAEIVGQLAAAHRKAEFEALQEKLVAEAHVVVDEAVLEKVEAGPTATAAR